MNQKIILIFSVLTLISAQNLKKGPQAEKEKDKSSPEALPEPYPGSIIREDLKFTLRVIYQGDKQVI